MPNDTIKTDTILKCLLATGLLIFILYAGKTLFIPLCYGLFIAVVLYPVCRWLEQHHWPKSIAIAFSLLLVAILFVGLLWLLVLQVNSFGKDLQELKAKVTPSLNGLQQWLAGNFDISIAAQNEWLAGIAKKMTDNSGGFLAGTFNKTTAGLFTLFIVPVFAALFLYNRKDFVLFLEKLSGSKNHNKLHNILHQSVNTYSHFIRGMIFVYLIVGVLNSAGLLALGIKHAVLFGFLAAFMTIIPYIGIFISALLPVTVAWLTKDSIWYPLGVVAVFVLVQYLEANIIFPRVVAAQLNISTWITLVAIIAGGILWGVSGMILCIPCVGILKIISDYIPSMAALNVLLKRSDAKPQHAATKK